jgi:2-polyprenyl-6-methoxyphenol hydroxylase-like FAD-dependent oxidoreductase
MPGAEMPTVETNVLVVGAGPSGLSAAMEIGLRGWSCIVADPRTTVSECRPRAKTTSVRTMEHFRRWGLADEIRAHAPLPVMWSQDAVFCTSLLGEEITRFHGCFGLEPEPVDLFAESGQQIPQPQVENVLRRAVGQLETVRLALGTRAVAIAETSTHVDVTIRSGDGATQRIRARYVLGCDGATGMTREAIGARYVGSSDSRRNLNVVFRAPGLAERVPHGPAVHYWVIGEEASGVLGRLDLADTWFASFPAAGDTGQLHDPSRWLSTLIGGEVDCEVVSTDDWTARMLLADRFASDRVFLVGDAAHLNPPWGGHGFNTGVGDAVNIGWKLAAVLAGWGGPDLLGSYDYERRMVASRTIDASGRHLRTTPIDLAMPSLTAPGRVGEVARATAAQRLQEAKRSEFHSLGLVLGYDYGGSPIIAEDHEPSLATTTDEVIGYQPTARTGARLPHAWTSNGISLYDQLGADYTLIRLDPDADPAPLLRAAAARGVPLAFLDAHTWLKAEAYGAPLVLVRPDQHVAWRGRTSDLRPDELFDLVCGHLRR